MELILAVKPLHRIDGGGGVGVAAGSNVRGQSAGVNIVMEQLKTSIFRCFL